VRRSEREVYVEIPSDRLTFELRPWMKAAEISDALLDEMRRGGPRFVRVNYANGDMVGHTGDRHAAIVAMEVVDRCLGRLLDAVRELDGVALITADHGNADEMYVRDKKSGGFVRDDGGRIKPKTSHTLNPVPFVLFDPRADGSLSLDPDADRPGLANVAATVLELLGFQPPADYEPSLLRRDPR